MAKPAEHRSTRQSGRTPGDRVARLEGELDTARRVIDEAPLRSLSKCSYDISGIAAPLEQRPELTDGVNLVRVGLLMQPLPTPSMLPHTAGGTVSEPMERFVVEQRRVSKDVERCRL